MKTIALTLLLVGAAFATAPTATAEDVCKDARYDATVVDVYTFSDCTAEVVVLEDLACLWGTTKHSKSVGPVTVSYYTCSNPDGASPNAATACIEKRFNAGPWGSYVEINADCTADVILFPNIICVGPSTGRLDRTVGPVHVQVTYCRAPTPPPDATPA